MKTKRYLLMLLVALMNVTGAWATDSGTFKYQNFSVSYSQSATIDPGRVTTEDNNVWINFAGLHPFYESAPSGGIKSVLVDYWLSNGSKGTTIYTKNQQKITKIEITKAKRETNENPEVTCYDSNGDAIPNVIRSYDGSGTTTLTFSGNVQYVVLKCSRDYYTSQGTVYFDYPEHIHNYDTSKWIKDNTYHWHGCSGTLGICHEPQKDKEVHLYSQSPEYTAASYTCSTCGYVNEQFKAHRHEYTQDWSADNSQHWHECTGTGGQCSLNRKVNLGDHVYDSTLGEVYNYTCATCGYVDEARKRVYDARDYMTMTAVGGDVTIGAFPIENPTYILQYSADKTYWTDYAVKDEGAIVTIPKGQTYYFRTASPIVQKSVMDVSSGHPTVGEKYWNFTMSGTGNIKAGGNIMSLLDQTCQSLTVGDFCFIGLFVDCTLLTDAPNLTATTLGESCYDGMFAGCTKLQKAPHLPATALPLDCYANMFEGCESLNYVEADFTETVPTNRYSYTPRATRFDENTEGWLKGTAAEGNLVLKREMIEKNFIDTDHIDMPTGWRKALKIKANEDPDNKGKFYTTYYDNKNIYITNDFKAYTGSIESGEGGYELRLDAISNGFIPSNTGVLIYSNKPDVVLPIYGYSVLPIEGNVLTGTNTDTTAPANCYILSYGQNGLAFYKYAVGKTLSAHKAYLLYERPAGAPALRMVFVDEETGIENINDDDTLRYDNDNIYSVSGICLNKLQKGINIVNGKKVVIK